MEFELVNKWKENELKRNLQLLDEFANEYAEYMKVNQQVVENKNRIFSFPESEREKIKIYYDEHYEQLNKFKRNNSYIYNIFNKVMYRYHKVNNQLDIAISKATEIFKKDIQNHFNSLQAKVENKIGRILEIKHLGGNDYRFKGELDECKVEVILAGGYNIQRLHTRWVIKK